MEKLTQANWIGQIISPVILLLQSFTSFCIPQELKQLSPLIPALQSNWLIMHVSVMLFSYAALILGCIFSIAFLSVYQLQKTQQLKKLFVIVNNLSLFTNWPENQRYDQFLTQLDNFSYRIIGIGFPFLTIGILSGAVWANEAWGSYWSWDPKETWALITWLWFAIYLHTRYMYQWSGIKSCLLGAGGLVIISVCYMGVNILGKGLHSYGWLT